MLILILECLWYLTMTHMKWLVCKFDSRIIQALRVTLTNMNPSITCQVTRNIWVTNDRAESGKSDCFPLTTSLMFKFVVIQLSAHKFYCCVLQLTVAVPDTWSYISVLYVRAIYTTISCLNPRAIYSRIGPEGNMNCILSYWPSPMSISWPLTCSHVNFTAHFVVLYTSIYTFLNVSNCSNNVKYHMIIEEKILVDI